MSNSEFDFDIRKMIEIRVGVRLQHGLQPLTLAFDLKNSNKIMLFIFEYCVNEMTYVFFTLYEITSFDNFDL